MVGRYPLLPDEIDQESPKLVQARSPRSLSLPPPEHYVTCLIVRSEGDPEIARAVRFSPGAVDECARGLRSGTEIITDVRMLEAGISRASLTGQPVPVPLSAPGV